MFNEKMDIENNPIILKRKYSKILQKRFFFPRPSINKPGSLKTNWFMIQPLRDRLYKDYRRDKGLRRILNKFFLVKAEKLADNLFNDDFMNFFEDLVIDPQPFIVQLNGWIRLGKSRLARKLILIYARQLKKNFRIHCDFTDLNNLYEMILFPEKDKKEDFFDVYVTYNLQESNSIISDYVKPGDVVYQDEMPKMSGDGSKTIKGMLENILNVCAGKKRINFIFVHPGIIEMDMIHYYIRVIGVMKPVKKTLALVSTGEKEHQGLIILDVDEPDSYTIYYEIISEKRKDDLRVKGGLEEATISKETKIKLANQLIDIAIKEGFLKYSKIKLSDFKMLSSENPLILSGIPGPLKLPIINRAYKEFDLIKENNLKKKKQTVINQIQIDFDKEFGFDERKLLIGYKHAQQKYPQRYAGIYLAYQKLSYSQMKSQSYIARLFGFSEQSIISKICSKSKGYVTGYLNDLEGKIYEKWLTTQLKKKHGSNPDYMNIENEGLEGQGKADIIIHFKEKIEIISVKITKTDKSKKVYELKDYKIEIEESERLKKQFPGKRISMKLHCAKMKRVDAFTWERDKSYENKINLENPQRSSTFRFE